MMKQTRIVILMMTFACVLHAQESTDNRFPSLTQDLRYSLETQASVSEGKTPLWLNANKHGLSSLDKTNGYLRAGVFRPLSAYDDYRKWDIGYGIDLVLPVNYTSKVIVHQAFAELRWRHGLLTVGSKEQPINLKNQTLSSGSQTLGINARPVPQVRLSLNDYWTLPIGRGWLHLKGHVAYGRMTDDNWQHTFTSKVSKYADDVLYHSKAGFLKIGNEDKFFPFSVEMGLEMASTFGGTAYARQADGKMIPLKGEGGLKGMWNAFIPGGADAGETTYQNASGNQLGSWMLRLNWKQDTWKFGIYADKFFEDHSSMFQLDYDGYGEGEEWMVRKKQRYFVYDFKDWMLGAELNFTRDRWITDVVLEYIYSKYQSGPIYHDHTINIADHIGGNDNFYNHYIYTGWQHWGQGIGNPLYRSPIYNEDGHIRFQNNRMTAIHLGLAGRPASNFRYRLLATYQDGLGTYSLPYTKKHHNMSLLLEGVYHFNGKYLQGCVLKAAYGMDMGKILGNNYGFQLTFSKTGLFVKQ